MSRTHKPVRLHRGPLSGAWAAVRVTDGGVITDKWPLHPDDGAQLDALVAERDALAAGPRRDDHRLTKETND